MQINDIETLHNGWCGHATFEILQAQIISLHMERESARESGDLRSELILFAFVCALLLLVHLSKKDRRLIDRESSKKKMIITIDDR
jgi:hypothetical protein